MVEEPPLNLWRGVKALMACRGNELISRQLVEREDALRGLGIHAQKVLLPEQQRGLRSGSNALAAHNHVGGVNFPLPEPACVEAIMAALHRFCRSQAQSGNALAREVEHRHCFHFPEHQRVICPNPSVYKPPVFDLPERGEISGSGASCQSDFPSRKLEVTAKAL